MVYELFFIFHSVACDTGTVLYELFFIFHDSALFLVTLVDGNEFYRIASVFF